MATTKERIILLLNNKGVTISNFFSSIGVSYSNFKGKQLESSPSADLVAKIKSNFPDVNTDWLLTGEGEMLAGNDNSNQTEIDMMQENFFDALKRRDQQFDELLEQNSRLISVIESLTGTAFKQSEAV